MVAPVALYPDSLLAQVLMASTYPGDVADAAAWAKAHPDAKGDDAVKQVASLAITGAGIAITIDRSLRVARREGYVVEPDAAPRFEGLPIVATVVD